MVSAKNQQAWRDLHGKNIKIQGLGYVSSKYRVSCDRADLLYIQWDQRLLTFDTKAINHIMVQAPAMFPKPWQSRRLVANLFGDGVLIAEGLP
jgi:hypothetical protein